MENFELSRICLLPTRVTHYLSETKEVEGREGGGKEKGWGKKYGKIRGVKKKRWAITPRKENVS